MNARVARRSALPFIVASVIWGFAPGSARAQDGQDAPNTPPAPVEPLTRPGLDPWPEQDQVARRDAAVLTVSTSASAGTGTTPNSGGTLALDTTQTGQSGLQIYSDLQAGFKYSTAPAALMLQISAGSAIRRQLGQIEQLGDTVGASLGYSLGRVHLSATQSFGYLPFYSLAAIFPTQAPNPDTTQTPIPNTTQTPIPNTVGELPSAVVNYAIVKVPAYVFGSSVGLSTAITARSSLAVSYGTSRTDYVDQQNPSLSSWSGLARYTYGLTQYLDFRAGYGRQSAQYSSLTLSNPVVLDNYDVGLGLHRALSLTRTTTLGFSSGSTVYGASGQKKTFYVTGSASLDHAIGRTAHVGVSYNRGVSLVPGFVAPVLSDSVGATARWGLSNRLMLSMVATAMLGAVGEPGAQNRYRNYTGSGQLSFAVSRNSSLFASYYYYQYELGAAVQQIAPLPGAQASQTGRVGFTLNVPLIREWVRPR